VPRPVFVPHVSHHATFLGLHVTGDLTAGDVLVGVGTLLLALLAYLSVRVARASMVAQDAPLVIGAHVPAETEVAQKYAGLGFDPPRAGLLPDGYFPSFVMRLWNVGRGPAVVQDVRLDFGSGDALRPMPSHVIVDAGRAFDGVWTSLDVAEDQRDAELTGTLRIIYSHPNGDLLETVSRVDLRGRALFFRTILRRTGRRRPKGAGPRQPAEPPPAPDSAGD
jgi:hypothetical protein